jgi:hypothetical protein
MDKENSAIAAYIIRAHSTSLMVNSAEKSFFAFVSPIIAQQDNYNVSEN